MTTEKLAELVRVSARESARVYQDAMISICNAEANVKEINGILYVVFRGTEDLSDVCADLKVRPRVLCGQISSHSGASEQVDHVLSAVVDAASGLGARHRPVVITGHSLGGAMAVDFALKCLTRDDLLPVRALVTFGQPRTTNEAGVALLTEKTTYLRIVHNNDLVVLVPPAVRGKFAHGGVRLYLDEDARFVPQPMGVIMMEQVRAVLHGDFLGGLQDHYIASYLEALDQNDDRAILDAIRAAEPAARQHDTTTTMASALAKNLPLLLPLTILGCMMYAGGGLTSLVTSVF